MTVVEDTVSSATSLVCDSRPISSSGRRGHRDSIQRASENTLTSPSTSENKLSTVHFSETILVSENSPEESSAAAAAAAATSTVIRKRDKAKAAGKTGAKAVGTVLLGVLGCFCFVLGKACILDGGGTSRSVVYADSAEKAEEYRMRMAMLEMERRQHEREMMYRKPGPKPRSRAPSQVNIGAMEGAERRVRYDEQGGGPRRRVPPTERRSTGTIAVRQGQGSAIERRQMERRRAYSAER